MLSKIKRVFYIFKSLVSRLFKKKITIIEKGNVSVQIEFRNNCHSLHLNCEKTRRWYSRGLKQPAATLVYIECEVF